jgi:hypothetical protein
VFSSKKGAGRDVERGSPPSAGWHLLRSRANEVADAERNCDEEADDDDGVSHDIEGHLRLRGCIRQVHCRSHHPEGE